MSTNYLSVILAWMKQNPSHLNWDLTYAVRPEQVNDLVELAHYSREGSALGDIDGEIALPGTGITHILTGYRMGPPRLSDLEAAYASPKVRQTIEIEGGSQLIMDHSEGLLGMAVHDPLDPLRVSQQLLLNADDQGVHADLGESVETELDVGGSLAQRLAAGRFFNDFVSGLDSARRIYPLVDFKALYGSAYLQVRDSAVRTHISKENGKPALVVFAGLEHGSSGNFPTELTHYPFLLPDDLEQPVSSTLMLSSQLLHRAAYGRGLAQMLEEGAFESYLDANSALQRMDAKAGQLRVHPSTYESRDFEFACDAFVIPVGGGASSGTSRDDFAVNQQHSAGCCCCEACGANVKHQALDAGFEAPLTIEFDHDEVRQHWKSYCTLTLHYRSKRSSTRHSHTATFQFDLHSLFHLDKPTPEESAGCMLLGHVLWPWQQTVEVTPVSGLPDNLAAQVKAEISEFVAFVIKQAVLEGLAKNLTATIPEQVIGGIALAAEHRITAFHNELPDGMALFANHNGVASFRIVDPPVMLAPGKRHAFTTEPVLDGLNWTIEALPGAVGDIGRIDRVTGEYRAPPLHAMGGEPVRVRVIATDAAGQRSSTLATVLLGALTVNPLIRVCYIDDQLTLTAGSLAGELRWSMLDPEGEGRGALAPSEDGKRCTYTAGGLVPGNQTYVLDEIKVQNIDAGESRTVHVLVRQRRPELTIEIVDQLPDGSLQLQGRVNGEVRAGVEWRLPIEGTGEIRDGRYTPPSSDADKPFALIIAKWEIPGFDFVFEGHLILPLPLALHFDTQQRATSPAGLRVNAKLSSRG